MEENFIHSRCLWNLGFHREKSLGEDLFSVLRNSSRRGARVKVECSVRPLIGGSYCGIGKNQIRNRNLMRGVIFVGFPL